MELLTVREVAALLKISPRQVWNLVKRDLIPLPVRVARSVRWRASDISKFIENGCCL